MAKRETRGPVKIPPRFNESLKRLTLDMQEATRLLVHAELPQDTLEGLSQAVDHLRSTCWAVLNSVVDEFSDAQRATVILTSHRIQRTTQLMDSLNEEVDAGRLTRQTQGVDGLRNTLGVVYKKLHYLTTGKPAPPEAGPPAPA
ncbi:MAG: hypothetical protein A2620_04280 [Acidobacteria bacterium RIFCSPHIGHO2_01_FULL_67_28]|nr:MAG: hypothetical protein A2620_04280 [Acidobacteria bacterium RIFCSPHIGHO2_01_FULL_67_28]